MGSPSSSVPTKSAQGSSDSSKNVLGSFSMEKPRCATRRLSCVCSARREAFCSCRLLRAAANGCTKPRASSMRWSTTCRQACSSSRSSCNARCQGSSGSDSCMLFWRGMGTPGMAPRQQGKRVWHNVQGWNTKEDTSGRGNHHALLCRDVGPPESFIGVIGHAVLYARRKCRVGSLCCDLAILVAQGRAQAEIGWH